MYKLALGDIAQAYLLLHRLPPSHPPLRLWRHDKNKTVTHTVQDQFSVVKWTASYRLCMLWILKPDRSAWTSSAKSFHSSSSCSRQEEVLQKGYQDDAVSRMAMPLALQTLVRRAGLSGASDPSLFSLSAEACTCDSTRSVTFWLVVKPFCFLLFFLSFFAKKSDSSSAMFAVSSKIVQQTQKLPGVNDRRSRTFLGKITSWPAVFDVCMRARYAWVNGAPKRGLRFHAIFASNPATVTYVHVHALKNMVTMERKNGASASWKIKIEWIQIVRTRRSVLLDPSWVRVEKRSTGHRAAPFLQVGSSFSRKSKNTSEVCSRKRVLEKKA